MKGLLIFIAGAILGAVVTFGVATGLGAGAGIVTGMQAGACLTVETAKRKGLLTPDQVNEILADAKNQIISSEHADDSSALSGDLKCEKIVADLQKAAAEGK